MSHLHLLQQETPLITGSRTACSLSPPSVFTLRQTRAEKLHVFFFFLLSTFIRENQRQLRKTQRGSKSSSDWTTEERKHKRWVPGLLTTTCMCPPVVFITALTKRRHPRGIKVIRKSSLKMEDFGKYSLKDDKCTRQLSCSQRLMPLRGSYI